MSVSSTFFNAVNTYSASKQLGGVFGEVESTRWMHHPLNWGCNGEYQTKKKEKEFFSQLWYNASSDDDARSPCFQSANVAKKFFIQLLKPLESHFGNCREVLPESRFTWICPSHYDPDDALSLHVHPGSLSFESKSKGSGKCWTTTDYRPSGDYSTSLIKEDEDARSFACEAWNSLEDTDHLLQLKVKAFSKIEAFSFNIHSSIVEYNNKGQEIARTNTDLGDVTNKRDTPSKLIQFLRRPANLQNWQNKWENSKGNDGLFRVFAAATKSEPAFSKPVPLSTTSCPANACPTPASANCPASSGANTNSDSTQSNGFAFGLICGVIGTVSAVSALVLLRKKKNQAQPSGQPLGKSIH